MGEVTTTKRRAVVIGGGLGGLATAVRLAARGWRVEVCEQGLSLGGKMNTFERDGFRFDTGPSLITMPWVFEELFEAAGSSLARHVTLAFAAENSHGFEIMHREAPANLARLLVAYLSGH